MCRVRLFQVLDDPMSKFSVRTEYDRLAKLIQMLEDRCKLAGDMLQKLKSKCTHSTERQYKKSKFSVYSKFECTDCHNVRNTYA